MGKNFRETLNKQMANPEFKAEYDALESRTIKRSEEQFAELRAHYEKIRRTVKK